MLSNLCIEQIRSLLSILLEKTYFSNLLSQRDKVTYGVHASTKLIDSEFKKRRQVSMCVSVEVN